MLTYVNHKVNEEPRSMMYADGPGRKKQPRYPHGGVLAEVVVSLAAQGGREGAVREQTLPTALINIRLPVRGQT